MNSALRAAIWEQWRTSRIDILFRTLYATGFVSLFAQFAGESDSEQQLIRGLTTLILLICGTTTATWLSELSQEHAGFRLRQGFARPVSTWQLVGVPTAMGVVFSMISFVVPAWSLTALAGISMPILGPLCFIACAVVCCSGAVWSWTTMVDRVLALGGLMFLLVSVGIAYHATRGLEGPALLVAGHPDYFRFSGWLCAVLVGTTMLAFAGTVTAVDRQRHGDGWSLTRPLVRWFHRVEIPTSRLRPFANRFVAHAAYELRRCGPPVITLAILAPGLLWVFAKIMLWMYPHAAQPSTLWLGEPVLWMLGIILSPIAYEILALSGALGVRQGHDGNHLVAFDATRPMTNDELVGVKLAMVSLVVFAGWLFMWLGSILFAVTDAHVWPRLIASLPALQSRSSFFYLGCVWVIAMTYIGCASFLFSMGLWMPNHPRILATVILTAFGHAVAALYDGGRGWLWVSYWQLACWVLSFGIMLGGVWIVITALRLGALRFWAFAALVFLWIGYAVVSLTLWDQVPKHGLSLPFAAAMLGCALLTVPLSATVSAPLALAYQRHRC